MVSAIHFDDKLFVKAYKIYDIVTYDMLSDKTSSYSSCA